MKSKFNLIFETYMDSMSNGYKKQAKYWPSSRSYYVDHIVGWIKDAVNRPLYDKGAGRQSSPDEWAKYGEADARSLAEALEEETETMLKAALENGGEVELLNLSTDKVAKGTVEEIERLDSKDRWSKATEKGYGFIPENEDWANFGTPGFAYLCVLDGRKRYDAVVESILEKIRSAREADAKAATDAAAADEATWASAEFKKFHQELLNAVPGCENYRSFKNLSEAREVAAFIKDYPENIQQAYLSYFKKNVDSGTESSMYADHGAYGQIERDNDEKIANKNAWLRTLQEALA